MVNTGMGGGYKNSLIEQKVLSSNNLYITNYSNTVEDYFNKNCIFFKQFKIEDLFNKINLKKINQKHYSELRSNFKDKVNNVAGISCKSTNNGILCYVKKEDFQTTKNKLVVTSNGVAGVVYYHKDEFTIINDAYALEFKETKYEKENVYLYLKCALQKAIFKKFEYSNKATWNKVKLEHITLPIIKNEIAFEFMENYIKEFKNEILKKIEHYIKK